MSLRFLVGPAGSGKTRLCLEEIVAAVRDDPRAEEPLYFLVPEQATFQTERALLEFDDRVTAVSRARVVSFKRLAYLALEREGPLSRPFIGELGRLLALQAAVKRERNALMVYRGTAETEGFVERIAFTLQELKAYRHDADSLRSVRERLADSGSEASDLLAAKLGDLERIYRRYQTLIAGRFHDGEDALTLGAAAVRNGMFAAGAHVWIDGFAGFTPQEYEFLSALLAKAGRVTVALCLDPAESPSSILTWDEGPVDGLFHPTRETLVKLRELAAQTGIAIEEPVMLGKAPPEVEPRFAAAPLLGRLERALVESEGALYPVEAEQVDDGGEDSACSILEAPDQAGEVEAAARTIVRLVRERGYRYSDIALVARTLDAYQPIVENVFRAWNIPFFIDQKGSAIHHPLVLFVESALDMLADGIDTPAMVRWLKTDLSPLSRDEADRLENRAIELGADGAAWREAEQWGELDGARASAIEPLERFIAAVRSALERPSEDGKEPLVETAPAHAFARALYDLLEDVGAPDTIEAWANEAERDGRRTEAGDHRLVWEGLCGLLDEIAGVMGDAKISAREFVSVCELGLKRLRLGRVPAHVDEVLVGSVDRSRQPELKCVILLGWNEGAFPLEPVEDPILSDSDREALRRAGLVLGPESKERLFHERYLIYIALTRASERLVLVYSRSDEAGRPLRPSPVISWLSLAFPGVRAEVLPAFHSPWVLPERPGALPGWLVRGFRAGLDGDPVFQTVERRLRTALRFVRERLAGDLVGGSETSEGDWKPIDPLAALEYVNRSESISEAIASSLYESDRDGRILISPSGLEDAAACPFRFFAGYGLKLRERPEPKLDAALLGTVSHAVLRDAVSRVMEGEKDWAEYSYEESDALVDSSFESVAASPAFSALRRSSVSKYTAMRLRRALQAAFRTFVDAARAGAFRPAALEAAFGPGASLPPLIVGEGRNAGVVRGRIDRIDEATVDGHTYVRVIDYKSSARPMRLSEVYYGLDMQLCIYLAVLVWANRDWYAAGCLYVPVVDPVASVNRPDEERDVWRKALKPHGLIVDDGIAPRLMDSVSTGSSALLPLFFKQDGTLGKNSQAAPVESVRGLLTFVVAKAGGLVEQVARGDTSIAPFEHGNERACTHCAYKPVCQFDPTAPPMAYRRLRPLRDEEVWERIEEEGGDVRVG